MTDVDYRDIKQWIVEQIQAGHPGQVLLQSMSERGWRRDLAMGLIAQATGVRSSASGGSSAPDATSAQDTGPPRATLMPAPALDDAPVSLDAGDRKVSVLLTCPDPQIVLFGDFLSDSECELLVEAARPRLLRSPTTDIKTGGNELNDVRTSDGMFFKRGETSLVSAIEARIARLVAWPVEKGEGIQVLRYRPGTHYEPHYDYFDPACEGAPVLLARGGQRVATFLMYLREPEGGGATVFPDMGMRIVPRRGSALFFSYDRPHPSTKTLHGGASVLAGEKWIATKWLREGVFE
jgi:prolyl 4-hydroxylase